MRLLTLILGGILTVGLAGIALINLTVTLIVLGILVAAGLVFVALRLPD